MVKLGLGLAVASVIFGVVAAAQPDAYVTEVMGDGFEGAYIAKVPDASQPPPNPLGFQSVDNWCAPLAAANAIVFLDQVAEAEWAIEVSGGLSADGLSAYLGYAMATNGEGSPDRLNASPRRPGTMNKDIPYGIMGFVEWNGEPPPGERPMQKTRHSWRADLLGSEAGIEALWDAYRGSIERGIPAVLCFAFWNPIRPTPIALPTSREDTVITFYLWGNPIMSTDPLRKEDAKIPEEKWDDHWGIGHAVTGVGFLKGDPDGRGPLPETLWVIVHDNWSSTAEHVAIPWEHLVALIKLLPD